MTHDEELYGGADPNDFPLYGIRDASRCVKIASATLRAWFVGTNRGHFRHVLEPAEVSPVMLSFNNLAEAYVLGSLRTEHDVRLSTIRKAIAEAETELGISRLLLRRDLKADAGDLLIKKFGEYIRLGASGQLAMKQMLDAVLDRFVWEDPDFPSMLFPFLRTPMQQDRVIVINPRRSFGAPALTSRGVTTAVISMRFNVGEPIPSIADDYRVSEDEITAAIVYEEAA
jgi:uncharacterized protein (DUF433 family)